MSQKFSYYKSLKDKGLLEDSKFFELSNNLYNSNPSSFSTEDVDYLEGISKKAGVDFSRNLEDDERKISSAINQLVSGVVEGFTTFGWADDPKNQTEAILNKMGHLIGFAPDIIAGVLSFGTAPLAKRGALKGINLVRANAAKTVEQGLGNIGAKYIPALTKTKKLDKKGKDIGEYLTRDKISELTKKGLKTGKEYYEVDNFQLRSVPMRVADFFVDNAQAALGKSDRLKNSFFASKLSDAHLDIIKQSAHLSVAMAISSRKAAVAGDWEAVRESAVHGAYAGAVFGSIANYMRIGDLFASGKPSIQAKGYNELKNISAKLVSSRSSSQVDTINMITRGIAGSAFTGGPTTLQEAPAADQVYEYLLGFFFGASGRPVYETKVSTAIQNEGHKLWKPVIVGLKKDGTNNVKNIPVGQVKNLTDWKDWGPKEREYALRREGEFFENYLTDVYRKDNDFYKLVTDVAIQKLNRLPKSERKAIEEARNLNSIMAEANAEVIKNQEIAFKKSQKEEVARRENLENVDIKSLEIGEKVEIFTIDGGVEEVQLHKKFKNGKIRIKDFGGKIHTVGEGVYTSENLYNPNYKVDVKVSNKFGGKTLDSLSKEQLSELSSDVSSKIENFGKKSTKTEPIKEPSKPSEEPTITSSSGQKFTKKQLEKSIKGWKKRVNESESSASEVEKASIAKQILDIYDSKSKKGTISFRHIETGKVINKIKLDVSKDSAAKRKKARQEYQSQWEVATSHSQRRGIAHHSKLLAELNAREAKTEPIELVTAQGLRALVKTSTAIAGEKIKKEVIPGDSASTAKKVVQDKNQLSIEFDRDNPAESDTYIAESDPVWSIVRSAQEKLGSNWDTLSTTMQIKKAAASSHDRATFKLFVKGFMPKHEFTDKQLNKIYFNSSGNSKQATKIFKADKSRIELKEATVVTKDGQTMVVNVPNRSYEVETKDTPLLGTNNESLDINSTGTFHNRLRGDSEFETILHYRESQSYGILDKAKSKPIRASEIEELSVNLHKSDGRFIYYANPSNNMFITRPLVDLSFKSELLSWFKNKVARTDYKWASTSVFTDGRRNSLKYHLKGSPVDARYPKLVDIDLSKSDKSELVVYESPYHKNPDTFYNEKISRATYLMQDAGYLKNNLSNVTIKEWQAAYGKYFGFAGKGGKPLYDNVTNFVKYSKAFHNGRTLDRELVDNFLKGRKLKVIVIEDMYNSAGELISDGGMHWIGPFRNALQDARGENRDTNYTKAVVQKEADFKNDRGMVLFKQAERQASYEMEQYALKKGYDGVVYRSSLKTNSRHQIGKLYYDKKAGIYTEKIKPEVIEIDPEHIRIIPSEVEVPNRDVIQMHSGASNIRNLKDSPGFVKAHKKMITDSISGNKFYMKKINAEINKNGYDFNTIDNKPVRLNDLDLYKVVDILNNHTDSKLGRSIIDSMYSDIEHLARPDRHSFDSASEYKSLDSINEILSVYDYDPLIFLAHGNKRYVEESMNKYVRNRLLNLRVPSGMSYPRLQSQDTALWTKLRKKGLTSNNFMLNDGHKLDIIKLPGGKKEKLGKIWEDYKKEQEDIFKEPEDMIMKEVIQNFLMNRSPVGNREGVLNLEFAGFTGQPGKGVHVTPKNMERLGGADTDGDAVAIYHGLDKAFVSAFKPGKVIKKEKTDVNLFPEWLYERNLGKNKDASNSAQVFKQGIENNIAAGNVGKSDNFNKQINDLFTFIKDSKDNLFPINNSGDVFLTIKDGEARTMPNSVQFTYDAKTGTRTRKNLKPIGKLKTLEEHYEYFNNYESDISLNLDLDGSKNTRNPDTAYKFSKILDNHFKLVDKYGNRMPWAIKEQFNQEMFNPMTGEPVIDWYRHLNGRVHHQVLSYNTSMPKGSVDKNGIIRSQSKEEVAKSLFTKNEAGDYIGIGKEMSIWRNINATFDAFKGTFFDRKTYYRLKDLNTEKEIEAYKEKLASGVIKKGDRASVSESAGKSNTQRWYEGSYKDFSLKKYNEFKKSEINPFSGRINVWTVEIIHVDPKKKAIEVEYMYESPSTGSAELVREFIPLSELTNQKGIDNFVISQDTTGKLKAKRDFEKALTKNTDVNGNKLRLNDIGEAARVYSKAFTKDMSTNRKYNNFMLDIAENITNPFETSGYMSDGVSIDMRIIPESSYPTLIANLGKSHAKVRKTHFYNHLSSQGLLSKDLLLNELFFDKISGLNKDAADMSAKELKVILEQTVSVDNLSQVEKSNRNNTGVNQEQHILEQLSTVAALSNLAIRYNNLRSSLGTRIEVKMIDNKISEMLTKSYDLKFQQYLSNKNLISKQFNMTEEILKYRKENLKSIGSEILTSQEAELLSNIFSKTLLSNILPEPGARTKEEYLGSIKKGFMNDKLDAMEKGNYTKRNIPIQDRAYQNKLDKKIEEVEKISTRFSVKTPSKNKELALQKYAKDRYSDMLKVSANENPASLHESLNTFNMYVQQQGMFNDYLYRSEAIPMTHKREFIKELRSIFDLGEIINKDSIEAVIQLPKLKKMSLLDVDIPTPRKETRKRSVDTEKVSITLDGTRTPIEKKQSTKVPKKKEIEKDTEGTQGELSLVPELDVVSKKVLKEEFNETTILLEKSEVDDVVTMLNNTQSQLSFKNLAERSIVSNLNYEAEASVKSEYVETNEPHIKIQDFRKSLIKKGDTPLVTERQAKVLKDWEQILDKNPKLLQDLEGNIASFFSDVGITGARAIGLEPHQMTTSEFEAFTSMVKDIYVSPDSRFSSRIKMFEKIQGIKDANDPVQVEKAKNKSPFNRGVHYWFYQSVGLYQLQKREMLSYERNNVPILDRDTGLPSFKTLITPTNTIELNVKVVDAGKTIAASLQDFHNQLESTLFNFKNSGDTTILKYDLELQDIATAFREKDYMNIPGKKIDQFSAERFDKAYEQAVKDLNKIKKESGDVVSIKNPKSPGDLMEVNLDTYIKEMNKARDVHIDWFKTHLQKDVEEISTGKLAIKKDIVDSLIRDEFLSDGKAQKRFTTFMRNKGQLYQTANELIGFNELNYIMYEYQIRSAVNKELDIDIQGLFEKKKPIPLRAKHLAIKLRKDNPFVPINVMLNNDKTVSNYWMHLGFNNYRENGTNINNHVKHLVAEYIKDVKERGVKAFLPNTRIEWETADKNSRKLKDYEQKSIDEFITAKTHQQSVRSYQDTALGDKIVSFIGKTNSIEGAFTNSSFHPRSEHTMLGYEKTNKALEQYVKQFIKGYTDTLSSIRGRMYIDRFSRKNHINDVEHTKSWASFMDRSLLTKLGLDSFVDLSIDGFTRKNKSLLSSYIASNLKISDMEEKLSYADREFIRKVDDIIYPKQDFHLRNRLEGQEYKDAIHDYRLFEANKLNDVKNINKIKRYGTAFHVVSDEAAVNFIRTQEERVGGFLGYKPGEFSFWKDLNSKISPITGKRVVMSENQRRLSLAQKVNAFSTFEGRYELMSLLFHPKTMIANYYGGGTNIYADVGSQVFKQALSEKYLVQEVFSGAEYEVMDPLTRKIIKQKVRNMKDIERIWVQKGLLEGMYLEEVGLSNTFKGAEAKRFGVALVKRMGKWERENPELSENPLEYEKETKLSIKELMKRYNVGEGMVQKGALFMSTSERTLRRTAATAHYLNARQSVLPLIEKGQMKWDSPFLIDMARKGIEASQYIYHSAYRSNYSNTSLGRVMTRFHPYAWNSIKRRRNLHREAGYTKFVKNTDSQIRYQRQMTADLMSMALASVFVGTMFEYALSPPMSWMQDTSQWLFGDKEERKRAFFSAWPHTSLAPLQIVTPPISRFVLTPVTALLNGEWDNFMKYQAATWAPGGRFMRDAYRTWQSPSMGWDWLTGLPAHRIGQHVKKQRNEVIREKELEITLDNN